MSFKKLGIMLLSAVAMAALMSGCGSSNKEGSANLGSVASAGADTLCIQCHSSVLDPLTNEGKMAQYVRSSPHNTDVMVTEFGLNGCEACHGGGAQHNGVGPIPYVNPYDGNGTRCATCHKGNYATNAPTMFADSKHANVVIETGNSCRRCHTHEGAVLSDVNGFTGEKAVLDNTAFQGAVPLAKEYTQFKCQTCHEHGGGLRPVTARDTYTVAGVTSPGTGSNIVNWNPSQSNARNDQFNLCTSCHNLKTYDGKYVMASGTLLSGQIVNANPAGTIGTAAVGHHEDTWYRVIATTHYNNLNNPAAGGITGYVIRSKGNTPCFDCHAHEAKTNTNLNNPNSTAYVGNGLGTTDTIYTDWASSAHGGGLLAAKYATVGTTTARSTALVDSVMQTVAADADPWAHYDWSGADRQDCQQCHTATGASNYLKNPATYDKTKNDFSHLFNAATGRNWSTSAPAATQREMLYCWGCHSNAGAGVIRNPGAISVAFSNGAKASFPDASSSNVCVSCHSGRESGASIDGIPSTTDMSNTGFINSHYMAAAGLMYVKSGYTSFVPASTPIGTSTYGASLTSDADGGALTSTHRKLGTAAMATDSHVGGQGFITDGPCVTCHMPDKNGQMSHSLAIDGNAFNAVCSKCHTSEGTTTLTAANFTAAFVDAQAEPFQNTLKLAKTVLANKYSISYNPAAYPYFYDLAKDPLGKTAVKDWTRGGTFSQADAKKLMGACFNINVLSRDPAAYVHARTYARRLLYDTIDFLDNGTIDLSSGATAIATMPTVFTKGATEKDAATSESMAYLLGYNRTTGAWSSPERP